jgi:N-acetylmuramoyl-L-alanine amidase
MFFRPLFLLMVFAVAPFAMAEKFDVVIDAGHGGKDTGIVVSFNGNKIQEKDITLDLALRIRAQLQAAGISVFMTREDDRHILLDKRRELIGAHCRYFSLSLHADVSAVNYPPVHSAQGMVLFYWTQKGRDGDVSFIPHSLRIGEKLRHELHIQEPIHAANFAILKTNACPSLFLGAGALEDSEDLARLANENSRKETADKIAAAIIATVKMEKSRQQ